MSYEDDLLAQARAVLGELRDSLTEVRESTREIIEEGARDIRADAHRDEERARQARRGDFGRDWVRLQERIDRGESSLSAVARGLDTSPEAQTVRSHTVLNLVDLRLLMEDAVGEPGEELPVIRIRGEEQVGAGALPPEARRAMAEVGRTMGRIEELSRRLRDIPLEDPD
ncbi:MAG: hypothetical protein LCH66_08335 [Actinobacteria bacterium]|jgi:hypothetical protein|nr:hypothetical protein [Actinomycetota bacterium]